MTAPEEPQSDSEPSFHFPTAPIVAPITTTSGVDLARDLETEEKAHPTPDLATLPLTTPLRRLTRVRNIAGRARPARWRLLNLMLDLLERRQRGRSIP